MKRCIRFFYATRRMVPLLFLERHEEQQRDFLSIRRFAFGSSRWDVLRLRLHSACGSAVRSFGPDLIRRLESGASTVLLAK
jgi:hypothetical protein